MVGMGGRRTEDRRQKSEGRGQKSRLLLRSALCPLPSVHHATFACPVAHAITFSGVASQDFARIKKKRSLRHKTAGKRERMGQRRRRHKDSFGRSSLLQGASGARRPSTGGLLRW